MRVEIKSFKIFFIHTVSKTIEIYFLLLNVISYLQPITANLSTFKSMHSWNFPATLPDVFNSCHAFISTLSSCLMHP